ncbi:hypothetical protein C731_0861 [Mycolicibacterium hassiacum DSM 44199]|uniref:Uncharacterized protein n=1 Tax=Mycolicibacterium hassiacum (strain DSM 44199 / CIP 105218 / JCM 12690 / 3849) TaxID=1122247 RepID=K5B9A7_MYCHD|nr:hypothetical protein [Mycolicibacterium hassiacum]EKF25118.1 hypothetical protein C731_0861 [Mycolicibacterium hassiacum DSM 44199]MBX5486090.1 hypothetical protein [Mycolicibacterium hassiacum]MDA4087866.1 hypothetical protein [Mycolicibacterium hassiacum DSM 44199]VCT93158.1 hypothetical protein MHAS_04897 [Mycolicibacterium hassiacum DSM 44199]
MTYVLALLVIAALAYVAWRLMRTDDVRQGTRVIGPDDDPEFLRRLGSGGDRP